METAARDERVLSLTVRDDGPGLSTAAKVGNGNGLGLANTRARLEQLYGDKQRFSVSDHPDGGVVVEIVIPFETVAAAALARSRDQI